MINASLGHIWLLNPDLCLAGLKTYAADNYNSWIFEQSCPALLFIINQLALYSEETKEMSSTQGSMNNDQMSSQQSHVLLHRLQRKLVLNLRKSRIFNEPPEVKVWVWSPADSRTPRRSWSGLENLFSLALSEHRSGFRSLCQLLPQTLKQRVDPVHQLAN